MIDATRACLFVNEVMGPPRTVCCLFIFMCLSVHLAAETFNISILEQPSSLLVPMNHTAAWFSCTAQCTPSSCDLQAHWVINGTFCSPSQVYRDCSGCLTLAQKFSIPAELHNNSMIRCVFEFNMFQGHKDSETATLMLLDEFDNMPFSPKPMLDINASHIINLTWSPPFLWPGHAIHQFNISVTNKSDGSVTYHQVDNNFSDRVVSFTKEIQDEPLMCIEVIVSISAISNYSFINTSQQPRQVFNVPDNILPLPLSVNFSKVITTNIHFLCDDLVDFDTSIQMQLPKVACIDQNVNLTFTIINDSDGIILREKNTIQQDGSSAVIKNLSCILAVNHSYSLTVEAGDGYQINMHVFDTFVGVTGFDRCSITNNTPDIKLPEDGLIDFLLMSGSLTIVLCTILTVITSYYFCYYRKKRKEHRFEELRIRIHNSLVNNPTYNPMPVYEQISPRYIPQTTSTIIGERERSTQTDSGRNIPASDNYCQTSCLSDTTDASTTIPTMCKSIHPTLTLDESIDNSIGFYGGEEGTHPAVSATMMQIKQDEINNDTD